MKPMLIPETAELVTEVMDSNPGALSLIERLTHRTRWYEIMRYCLQNGIVGDKLWQMYKEECDSDIYTLGDRLESAWQTSESQSTETGQSPSEWATPSSILAQQVSRKE